MEITVKLKNVNVSYELGKNAVNNVSADFFVFKCRTANPNKIPHAFLNMEDFSN